MDRRIPMPSKLELWATAVSHEFLTYHDPETLRVNTAYTFDEWIINEAEDESMTDEESTNTSETDNVEQWNTVNAKGRARSKSPTKDNPVPTSYSIPGWTREATQDTRSNVARTPSRAEQKQYEKLVKPASRAPQGVPTVKEGDEDATHSEEAGTNGYGSIKDGGSIQSEALPRPIAFPAVPVNDGTHRVSVKWKPTGGMAQYGSDTQKLHTEITKIINNLFEDDDGHLYPWGSEEKNLPITSSQMTIDKIGQYVTSDITFLKSTNQVVFSIRFAFTDNPIKWSNTEEQRNKGQTLGTEVRYYNSRQRLEIS